jgi:hypothetical protein
MLCSHRVAASTRSSVAPSCCQGGGRDSRRTRSTARAPLRSLGAIAANRSWGGMPSTARSMSEWAAKASVRTEPNSQTALRAGHCCRSASAAPARSLHKGLGRRSVRASASAAQRPLPVSPVGLGNRHGIKVGGLPRRGSEWVHAAPWRKHGTESCSAAPGGALPLGRGPASMKISKTCCGPLLRHRWGSSRSDRPGHRAQEPLPDWQRRPPRLGRGEGAGRGRAGQGEHGALRLERSEAK